MSLMLLAFLGDKETEIYLVVVVSNGNFFLHSLWFLMNFYSSIKSLVLWPSVHFSLWIHFWSRKLWGFLLSCPGTLTRIWCCHRRVILEEATWWEVLSFIWYVKLRSLLSMALLKLTSVSCQTFHFPVKLILKIKDCVWDITKPIWRLFLPRLHCTIGISLTVFVRTYIIKLNFTPFCITKQHMSH